MTRLLLISLGLLLSTHTAHAGPWLPEPQHGYAKIWLRWLPGLEYNDDRAKVRDVGSYHELFFNAYGELGVAPGIALWLHAPALRLFIAEDLLSGENRVHVHPGDPTLGMNFRLARGAAWSLALSAGVTLPVTTSKSIQTIYEEPETEGDPPTVLGELRVGTGIVDVPIRLSAGYGWSRIYIAGSFAYIFRSDSYAHDLAWSAESGFRPQSRKYGLRLRVHGRYPLPMGTAPRHLSLSGVGNGTSYTAFAGEFEYYLRPTFAVGLTIEGGLFGVRRQSRGPVISATFAWTF